ncbi:MULTISPECIES: TetR/AcrR family transcriptional regulator [Williamsia]|uniref:TetR/AcrR family transcriptional regulator n=1 Tax=Williamsia marianensis TaxID=85044 RepID=A0ABU4ET62_WILMA|nr:MULTISPECIES: TetR/AcrR family transcriptional regulator [Williamsia]ETD30250.1 TetR family transcriptional regulator [Williamsia sp. D3]MDV7134435.1 TetR/AcrR family transcriptional regulator [Williamsia muralis]
MATPAAPTHATARRAELFHELAALFLADGFAHLTLDQIAAQLRCSKSTLYTLAGSKDDLVRAVTVDFFRSATAEVEQALVGITGTKARLTAYLTAVGAALSRASETFMEDLAAFAPARELYEQNTRAAAGRVRELINEGVATGDVRDVHADFVADVATSAMVRIQQRGVKAAVGLDDSQAYLELAHLLTEGIGR